MSTPFVVCFFFQGGCISGAGTWDGENWSKDEEENGEKFECDEGRGVMFWQECDMGEVTNQAQSLEGFFLLFFFLFWLFTTFSVNKANSPDCFSVVLLWLEYSKAIGSQNGISSEKNEWRHSGLFEHQLYWRSSRTNGRFPSESFWIGSSSTHNVFQSQNRYQSWSRCSFFW